MERMNLTREWTYLKDIRLNFAGDLWKSSTVHMEIDVSLFMNKKKRKENGQVILNKQSQELMIMITNHLLVLGQWAMLITNIAVRNKSRN